MRIEKNRHLAILYTFESAMDTDITELYVYKSDKGNLTPDGLKPGEQVRTEVFGYYLHIPNETLYTADYTADGNNYKFETLHIEDLFDKLLLQGTDADTGATPIGFRIAMKHPEWIRDIISQNGNIYSKGLGRKWEARAEYWRDPTSELREQYKRAFAKDTVIGQYTYGTEEGSVSPDGYSLDLYYASVIPDYAEKQSDLIFDYQNNVKLYPAFQEYLRTYQPKLLAVWGKYDPSFIWAGAEAFARDLPDAKIVPVSSGHFAPENCCA